jgi:glycosyltransferase involved in cell wall biosynthesis
VSNSASSIVSVLVTVHNRESYLADCLTSILASSITDFEVVVVDDASTDASLTVAESFASADSRIKLHRNERNLGDYPNRMCAAQLAAGKYLKYVDSDDVIYRNSLSIMVDAMEANPEAALGLSHRAPEEISPYPWKLSPVEAWRKEFLGEGCLACGPSGAIIRRDRFFEAGGFGSWGVLSDTDMWYRMAARWPVVLLPPGLVWWRRHDGQEFTANRAFLAYLEDGFRLTSASLDSELCPLPEPERSAARARARKRHARRLLSLAIRSRRPRDAWKAYRKSDLGPIEIITGFESHK